MSIDQADSLRVLHVIHGFNTGGAETLVKDYLLLMQGKDITSRAVCFARLGSPFETQLDDAGVRITYLENELPNWLKQSRVFFRLFRRLHFYFGVRHVVREWQPDVIHSHLPVNGYVLFALGRNPRKGHTDRPVALFHTVHNEPRKLWFPNSVGNLFRLERYLDFNAATRLVKRHHMRFIALHDCMRREINELFGVNDTVVVNNGIDLSRFENVRRFVEVRSELGIPADAFVVGHVGRFAEQKNHAKVVSVFHEVYRRRQDAFLLLVGDGPARQDIERDLRNRGVDIRTVILSNRPDVPDLMASMDVFLFPSLYEGLPVTLIEAQVSRLPCVISDAIVQDVIISNAVRIRKLDDEDSAWADALLEPAPERVEYSNLEEWDMRNVVKRLEALYRGELLG